MRYPIAIVQSAESMTISVAAFPDIVATGKDETEASQKFLAALEAWQAGNPDVFEKWFAKSKPRLIQQDQQLSKNV